MRVGLRNDCGNQCDLALLITRVNKNHSTTSKKHVVTSILNSNHKKNEFLIENRQVTGTKHAKHLKRKHLIYLPSLPSRPEAQIKQRTFYVDKLLRKKNLSKKSSFPSKQSLSRRNVPRSIGEMAERVRQLKPAHTCKMSKGTRYRFQFNPKLNNNTQTIIMPTFLVDVQVQLPSVSKRYSAAAQRTGFHSPRLPTSTIYTSMRTLHQIEEDMKHLVLLSPRAYPFKAPPNSPCFYKRNRASSSPSRYRFAEYENSMPRRGAGTTEQERFGVKVKSVDENQLSENYWQRDRELIRKQYPMFDHQQKLNENYRQQKFTYTHREEPSLSQQQALLRRQQQQVHLKLKEPILDVEKTSQNSTTDASKDGLPQRRLRRRQQSQPHTWTNLQDTNQLRVSPSLGSLSDADKNDNAEYDPYHKQLISLAEQSLHERSEQHERQLFEQSMKLRLYREKIPTPLPTPENDRFINMHQNSILLMGPQTSFDSTQWDETNRQCNSTTPSIVLEKLADDENDSEDGTNATDSNSSLNHGSNLLYVPTFL